MTNDKATALLVHVQDLRDSGFKSVSISPTDLIALLAERERLRGALEDVIYPMRALERQAKERGGTLSGFAYTIARDLGFVQSIARQALEASHEPS